MKKMIYSMLVVLFFVLSIPMPSTSAQALLPSENFFKFPFPDNGTSWRMSGGPHQYNGTSGAFSSLDFKPANHSGCGSVASNEYVVSAAAGKVRSIGTYTVTIDHKNGWWSEYHHLSGITVKKDQEVAQGTKLGYPSCGGNATGAHVHFSLRNSSGTYVSIVGLTFEGWKVASTNTAYEGCLTHQVTLQKVCRNLYAVTPSLTNSFRSMRTTIYLESQYSKSAMTINNALPNYPSTVVIQNKWSNLPSQKWYVLPSADSGYYNLVSVSSKTSPPLCLDIANASTQDGARVQVYSCNNTNAQKFQFVQQGNEVVQIRAKHSGKIIQLPRATSSIVPIVQGTAISSATYQMWKGYLVMP